MGMPAPAPGPAPASVPEPRPATGPIPGERVAVDSTDVLALVYSSIGLATLALLLLGFVGITPVVSLFVEVIAGVMSIGTAVGLFAGFRNRVNKYRQSIAEAERLIKNAPNCEREKSHLQGRVDALENELAKTQGSDTVIGGSIGGAGVVGASVVVPLIIPVQAIGGAIAGIAVAYKFRKIKKHHKKLHGRVESSMKALRACIETQR